MLKQSQLPSSKVAWRLHKHATFAWNRIPRSFNRPCNSCILHYTSEKGLWYISLILPGKWLIINRWTSVCVQMKPPTKVSYYQQMSIGTNSHPPSLLFMSVVNNNNSAFLSISYDQLSSTDTSIILLPPLGEETHLHFDLHLWNNSIVTSNISPWMWCVAINLHIMITRRLIYW